MTSRGLDRIHSDECLTLLRANSFGRIGTKIAEELVILPVYYAVAGEEILFRTDPGTKLMAAALTARVAFEIDDRADGWSVLAIGHAYEVRSISPEYASASETLDAFWAAGERTDLVKITIEKIEGRRLHRPE
jgi:hypothetical protein